MSKTDRNKDKKLRKHRFVLPAVVMILLLAALWFEHPVTEEVEVPGNGLISAPIRIALITDLHSCYYGKDQATIVRMVDRAEVDLVLLGGDIFDDKLKDERAKMLITQLAGKYPTYYVTGNHEYWSGHPDKMKKWVEEAGAVVLDGNYSTLEVNGNVIDIGGVDDPTDLFRDKWKSELAGAHSESGHYQILVSHRPEEVKEYERYDYDLIVSGHAHGGQWRIPFTKRGYWAPNQGFFAEYVDGVYTLKNGSKMVVSRGLARESTPAPRFFNHPELVVITINPQTEAE